MDKNQKTLATIIASVIGVVVLIIVLIAAFGDQGLSQPSKYSPSTEVESTTESSTIHAETEESRETITKEETESDAETTDSPSTADIIQKNLELYFDRVEVYEDSSGINCGIYIDNITEFTDEKAEDFFKAAQAAIIDSRFRDTPSGMSLTFSVLEENIMLYVTHSGQHDLILTSMLSTPNTGGKVVNAFKVAYDQSKYFSQLDIYKSILG